MQISKDLFQPNENFETESSVTKFICISNLPTKDVYVCFFSFKTGKEHKSIDILLFQTNPAGCLSRRSSVQMFPFRRLWSAETLP